MLSDRAMMTADTLRALACPPMARCESGGRRGVAHRYSQGVPIAGMILNEGGTHA